MKKFLSLFCCMIILAGFLVGCTNSKSQIGNLEINTSNSGITSKMFSDRDMESGYDEENSTRINLINNGTKSDSKNVSIVGNTVTISDEGIYILSGSLADGQIIIDAETTDKIQIVLDNIEIGNASSAPIYVNNADKVFITLAKDSQNLISVNGEFISIDDSNIDAAIFSRDDLTMNGNGSLTIDNKYGNGITSKDELTVTNGIYDITVTGHGLEGKDSIRIANGEFNITSGKDGIHSENSDDSTLGFVYIANGNFNISSTDDGIHADSNMTIEDGVINIIKSYEGIEGRSIDINGGVISIASSDDGINATSGNDTSQMGDGQEQKDVGEDVDVYIKITGGTININAQGDGIDSNGNLYVTGGETYVSGSETNDDGSLDYDGIAHISGGIVVSTGSSGMAQNFGESSTQGSILIASKDIQSSDISLKDSNGKELLQYASDKPYNSVLISMPDIKEGETYAITMGAEEQKIEMTSLIYGNGGGRSKFGGGTKGERPERPKGMERPEGSEGMKRPEGSEGEVEP